MKFKNILFRSYQKNVIHISFIIFVSLILSRSNLRAKTMMIAYQNLSYAPQPFQQVNLIGSESKEYTFYLCMDLPTDTYG